MSARSGAGRHLPRPLPRGRRDPRRMRGESILFFKNIEDKNQTNFAWMLTLDQSQRGGQGVPAHRSFATRIGQRSRRLQKVLVRPLFLQEPTRESLSGSESSKHFRRPIETLRIDFCRNTRLCTDPNRPSTAATSAASAPCALRTCAAIRSYPVSSTFT